MELIVLLAFLTVIGLASGRRITLQNNHGETIWIGSLGNPGKGQPEDGGFALNSGESKTVEVADDWAGRFWARTRCNFDGNGQGHCATGDCGDKLKCNGAGGVPPATLAEFTLSGYGGQDFYDVSLVDGYNVAVQITPTAGGGSDYWCTTAGCDVNLNPGCPDNLRVLSDGNVVACQSSCVADNSEQSCCRGSYDSSDTCPVSPSCGYYKNACPGAYCYAFDDPASTYTCRDTDYIITIS